MHQFMLGPSPLPAGRIVLIGRRNGARRNGQNAWKAEFLRAVVVSDDRKRMELLDETGAERVLEPTNDPYSRTPCEKNGSRLLWSSDLPTGDEDAVRRFCQVYLDADTGMGLFHVVAIDDGRALVKLVMDRPSEPLDERYAIDRDAIPSGRLIEFVGDGRIQVSKEVYAIDLAPARDVLERHHASQPAVAVDDLIAARSYVSWIVEGMPTWRPIEWEVVDGFASVEEIEAFLPERPTRQDGIFATGGSAFGADFLYQRELDLAWASTEPDDALVLVAPDGSGQSVSIVSHRGRTLFEWDEPGVYFEDQAPGLGLWHVGGIKGWSYESQGEHDCGIDGDWRPATLDDVATFGMDIAAMDAEIADRLEDGSAQAGATERMIALTAESLSPQPA